ncbi:MAG: type II toxin-antitoxin system PemK/MazF family toxin [Methylocystis sp.]|nr:type II toxin-antitoxin system PemK/MazF family toxin [Methylocystis sp.]
MGRGDIYRVDLEPTIGSEQQGAARPCVILSISAFNKKLRTVVVVPLSSSPRPLPPLVVSAPSAGMATSTALCGQVRTIDKRRLKNAMGRLSPADLEAVEKGVRQVLGL